MILRVLHCNPLSSKQLRLQAILRATQRRAPVGLEIGSLKQFGCTIVEAGWAGAPLSNKSAGILIALRKPSLRNAHIRHGHHHHHWKVEHLRHVSKEVFFRFVCLLHVSSSQTTNCIEKRRVSEDCGTSVGMAGRVFE